MTSCDMCKKKMFKCKNNIEITINSSNRVWSKHENIILDFCPNCIEKVTKVLFRYIENHVPDKEEFIADIVNTDNQEEWDINL